MRRFQVALCIIGFATAFGAATPLTKALAQTQSAAPTLAPAQFTPLPVGTRVDYDTWSYRVTESDGFDVTYKAGNGWAHHYAVFGKSGDGVYDPGYDWTANLDGADKTALESLWPLKVGQKIRLDTEENDTADGGYVGMSWEIVIEVTGTEVLELNGVRYATYVVREQAATEGASASWANTSRGAREPTKYVAIHWYHPGSGLVLRSSKQWNDAASEGDHEEYRLTRVRYPEGTTNLALKGTPVGVAAAEADLAATTERAERQAEERQKAELARLKKAAEAKRKSETQTSETAAPYKAEITRLKQQAEIQRLKQGAEIARLKQQAEIARLRRQTEAGRQQELAAREAVPEKRGDRRLENALWTVARGSQRIDDTQAYLDLYPQGRYAAEAQARLSVLEKFAAIEGINFGAYHALVIGNNDYRNLPDLKTAVNDARTVAAVLAKDYGFKVKTLINATHADIINALDEYRETLTDLDNLLIYYAGHGWLDEDANRGYWLPVDARRNRRARWVSNATISDTLKTPLAKHVMVVADSCYSGTLARGAGVSLRTAKYWRRMALKRTRVALTSGGLEPVADKGGGGHSPFAQAFLDALKDNDVVMDATQLFSAMRRPVMVNANQTPEYSDVRNAGHDGGDFLFVKKF